MSNALEAASLIMVPSGYENGTLASVKPNDGTGDFTFSRGSNLSATRINEQGYIEKGYENLLLQSNSFDTTWANLNTTETGGQTGYDGTNDAWLLNKSSAGGSLKQDINTSGVNTFSAYVKAGSLNWIRIATSTGFVGCWINILDGVFGSVSSRIIDTNIESAGNDFYKISISFTDSISNIQVIPAEGNNVLGTSGSIYIQDAMLNQGLVAYPYIETTTAPVAGGILEDMPRLDWASGAPSLLLEPSRANELPNSEYLQGGILSNATLSLSGTSPENVNNAYALTETSANAEHYWVSERMTTETNNNLVSTIFVKPNGRTKIRLWNYHLANQFARVDVDLTNNTTSNGVGQNVTFVSANVTDAPNGWKRLEIQSVKTSSTYAYGIRVNLLDDSGNDVYAGDATKGVYIYGGQMEQDTTYPTSYIPTYGVSQTRLDEKIADGIDIGSFTSTYNTLFFDWGDMEGKSTFNREIVRGWSSTDNTTNLFRIVSLTDGRARYQVYTSSGVSLSYDYTHTTRDKIAIVFNGLNSKLFINGSLANAYSIDVSQGLRKFNYTGASRNVTNQFTIFPTALSDEECIQLTTV